MPTIVKRTIKQWGNAATGWLEFVSKQTEQEEGRLATSAPAAAKHEASEMGSRVVYSVRILFVIKEPVRTMYLPKPA